MHRTLMLQPTRLAQSAEDLNRGAARYQGVCVDSADGSWIVQEGAEAPRLAWRLEYEKSTVFFAADLNGDEEGKGVYMQRHERIRRRSSEWANSARNVSHLSGICATLS